MTDNTKRKPSLKERFFALFDKNFYEKVERARKIQAMLKESTRGDFTHFYNERGEQIRGFHKRSAQFTNVLPTHPLVVKYK
jgi:hypothetical protein